MSVVSVQTLFGTLDEKQLKSLKGGVEEIVDCMRRSKALSQSVSDIISAVHDETKVPKKLIRRMAKVQYEQTLQEEIAEFKEFEALLETINNIKV